VSAQRQWRRPGTPAVVLMLLCAMYFLYFVNRVSLSTVAPLVKTELGITNTQLGLVFSAFAIPYAVFQLIGGWIGDRLGARLTLALCCAIVALSTILTSITSGVASLFVVRLALGFGEGAGFPTATRAMASWTARGRWGFAQGIVHSFARIGNAVTPPLMAGLLLFSSWRGAFAVLGLATMMWPLVWAWFFRNDPREHPGITADELALLPGGGSQRQPSAVPWLRLARHILPVTLVDFCYGWTLWLFLSWLPVFFFENYHLNLQASAMFTSGVLLAGVIGDTAGGVVSDRLLHRTGSLLAARRSVIVVGFLGAFVFLVPVVLIHDLTIAAMCLSLAFFFAELIVGPIWSVPMDIAPDHAGTASGMMNFGFALAGFVSPSSFGFLVDRTGSWVVPFLASIVLLLVGAVLASRLRPDRPFESLAIAASSIHSAI
jgi:MFS family permease